MRVLTPPPPKNSLLGTPEYMYRLRTERTKGGSTEFLAIPASNMMIRTNGGSKNVEQRGEDNLSSPSTFISNAHNEIYAFYAEKAAF